jgi:hypothetical protein
MMQLPLTHGSIALPVPLAGEQANDLLLTYSVGCKATTTLPFARPVSR